MKNTSKSCANNERILDMQNYISYIFTAITIEHGTLTATHTQPTTSSSNLSNFSIYIIIIITIAIFVFCAVYWYKKKRTRIKEKTEYPINKNDLKKKVDDYFESFKNDRKDYKSYSFYRIQFELSGFKEEYKKKVEYISSLYSLGFKEYELDCGKQILREKVKYLTGMNTNNLTEGNCIVFLLDYYEEFAKQEALRQIKAQVKNEAMGKFNRYWRETEERINELINGLKSS